MPTFLSSLPSAPSLHRRRYIDLERETAPRVSCPSDPQLREKGKSTVIGLLLVCLLLVLLFGGLGLAISPMFFLLVIVLMLAMGWGGFYRRGH